jgi:hypothetical protein
MKPKDGFDAAMERVNHLLRLYDVLHNIRSRKIRKDWAANFLNLMRWPKDEAIVRIDGKERQSLLILRPSLGLDHTRFTHDYLSELLRSAVVATASALDRYIHDLVLHHSWALLQQHEDSIPPELKKLTLPVLATKYALEKLRADPQARPGHLVKAALQEHLHRDHTFQRPDDLARAARMLGVEDFWAKIAKLMPGTPAKGDVVEKLRVIAARRNQIVHEADIVRKMKAKKITLRDITRSTAEEWCTWTRSLVAAIDQVVAAAV